LEEALEASPELVNSGGDYGLLSMASGFAPLPVLKQVLRYNLALNRRWYANNYFGYAMDRARRTGSLEVLELLLKAGADVNVANWMGVTYLHKAAFSGPPEIVTLLLKHGANPAARDDDFCSTPLGWAARAGRLDLVEALLENGVPAHEPEAPPWATPLSWALKKGREKVAIRLQEEKSHARS
jgi:ankyrin repeat protein